MKLTADLLELDGTDLESTFDICFTGWNRSPTSPMTGATISFPDDEPKQIAIENDPIVDCATGGCSGGFGADFWRAEGRDHADTPSVPAASAWARALLVGLLMALAGWAIRRPNGRAADPRAG
jgi:hypothetical protein